MKYDDMTWHSEGDFPSDLENEAAATHIGMFIAWAAMAGLISNMHILESKDDLELLLNRKITGRDFLLKNCDGMLTDDDLNEDGNEFAKQYLEEEFIDDYVQIVPDELESIYHLEDSWDNFDKLKPYIDYKYSEWQNQN